MIRHRTGSNAPPGARPTGLRGSAYMAALLALVLSACGGGLPASPADASDGAATDVPFAPSDCAPPRVRPDGTCCPPGQVYLASDETCAAIGPTACGSKLLEDPAACVPRWCSVWQDDSGAACSPPDTGCQPVAQPCEATTLTSLACPAGEVPVGQAGGCRPAGDVLAAGAPAHWGIPTDATTTPPHGLDGKDLPHFYDTRLCSDGPDEAPRFCTVADPPCGGPGDPVGSGCIRLGVPWVCPEGYSQNTNKYGSVIVGADVVPICGPDPCGEDTFGGVADGPGLVFVKKFSPGKAGTRAQPVATLDQALAMVPAGGTVVLGKDYYDPGPWTLDKDVTILGACASEVRLGWQPVFGDTTPRLRVTGAVKVRLRGLRVGWSSGAHAIVAEQGAQVEVSRSELVGGALARDKGTVVVIDRSRLSGVHDPPTFAARTETGAVLSLEDVQIAATGGIGVQAIGKGTQLTATRVEFFAPVTVGNAAAATLVAVSLRKYPETGLLAYGKGTSVDVRASLLGTWSQFSQQKVGALRGITVQSGARLTLRGCRASGNAGGGMLVTGTGTEVIARDVFFDATRADPEGAKGYGIKVQEGARLDLQRARLHRNRTEGLVVLGPGTEVSIQDLLIDWTEPGQAQAGGKGLLVSTGATATLERVHLAWNRDIGLTVKGAGTLVKATDFLVEYTLPKQADKTAGWGIGVYDGARLALTRARLASNRTVGLVAYGAGSAAELHQVLVDGTLPAQADGLKGRGIEVHSGASARLDEVRLSGNRDTGLRVTGAGTRVTGRLVLVDSTHVRIGDKQGGHGIAVTEGAELRMGAMRLETNHEIGLLVDGEGSRADIADAAVVSTLPVEWSQAGGRGISVQDGGRLQLAGARITQNREVGLFASGATTRVDASGLRVGDTFPTVGSPSLGNGIWVVDAADLHLDGSLLFRNRTTGVGIDRGTARLKECAVVATLWSAYKPVGAPRQAETELADGVLVRDSPSVHLERCLVAGNLRSGVFAEGGQPIALQAVLATGSLFGLVSQAGAAFDESTTLVVKNSQNRLSDKGLATPPPPEAVVGAGD